ncbi:MAG: PLP-dependent aminotransferase family protein, partial [Lachnospiraceae bacterium]|nr:PLP-dependent aminotransferase family protein [Lachnospiraceae bacterium]
MHTYSFENLGDDALYIYLYKCIRADILSGALKTGERLPSKRAFARQLNISTITIENAYALLQTEGYIYSEPKRGYFASDIQAAFVGDQNLQQGAVRARTERQDPFVGSKRSVDFAPESMKKESEENGLGIWPDFDENDMPDGRASATDRIAEQANSRGIFGNSYFADFSSNQTRKENFPFSVWARLIRQVMADRGEHLLRNAPGGGVYELRKMIAAHLREFRDMYVSPEQVIVGAGTEYLYGILIQLLGFDSVYAVENPGYSKIGKIYEAHGVACRYIDMDGCGICPDLLEEVGANVIHITPSHHFPTGITMPISRRYELLAWAARAENRYIIEDDYDSEFRMTGKPIPTLQSIDWNGQVIYINTFTKTLASTIRISYMVLPEPLLALYRKKLSFYSCTVSNFEQYTLAAFIREGHYEKHINRMRNSYRRKRNALLEAIEKSPLAELVTISEEDAGLHFLMKVNTERTDEEIIESAKQQGIRLTSLSYYYHDEEMVEDFATKIETRTKVGTKGGKNEMAAVESRWKQEHTFVINYSNIEEELIAEAGKRLYE